MAHYRGHKKLADGTRVNLTEEEAKDIWEGITAMDAERAEAMPTTQDALEVMHTGRTRLRDLGWKGAEYCPKDGTTFAVIQYGSTGIFKAFYMGEWPKGHIYCCDCLGHPHGMMFKLIDSLDERERATLDECMKSEKSAHDLMVSSLLDKSA